MEKEVLIQKFFGKIRDIVHVEALRDDDVILYVYVLPYLRKLTILRNEHNYFENDYYSIDELIGDLLNNSKNFFNEDEILKEMRYQLNHNLSKKSANELIRLVRKFDDETCNYLLQHDFSRNMSMNIVKDTTDIELIYLIEKILNIKSNDSILDMCSGMGNFLSNLSNIDKSNKLTGIEINGFAIFISKMRTLGLGRNVTYYNQDALLLYPENKYDKIFSDFPLGIRLDRSYLNELASKPALFRWEKFPANTPDWVFINTMLTALKSDGVAVTITSNASLYKDIDSRFRADIIDNKYLASVIQLPTGIISGIAISLNLLIFNRNNLNNCVKLIDASSFCQKKKKDKNIITLKDIENIYKLYSGPENEYVKNVSYEELRNNNYNLVVNEYIGKKEIEYINPHKISEFAEDVFRGYQPMTNKDVNNKKEYELLTISDVDDGIISDNLKFIDGETKKLDRYILKENDVIVTCKGTVLKFAVVTNVENRKVIPSGNFIVIRLKENGINPYYLVSYLGSEAGIDGLYQLQTGASIFSINPQKLASMTISVLSNEKQENVAKKYKINQTQIALTKKRLNELKENMAQLYNSEMEG